MRRGICQVEIECEDQNRKAFTSPHGLYRFVQIAFKLRNALRTFQQTVQTVLFAAQWRLALLYFDDVVLFSCSVADHMNHERHVLTRLRDAGVAFKVRQCRFSIETIVHFGHAIRPRHLKNESHKADFIEGPNAPWNVFSLKMHLGFSTVVRQFLQNLAKIAYPLSDKLRNYQAFHFRLTEKELEA